MTLFSCPVSQEPLKASLPLPYPCMTLSPAQQHWPCQIKAQHRLTPASLYFENSSLWPQEGFVPSTVSHVSHSHSLSHKSPHTSALSRTTRSPSPVHPLPEAAALQAVSWSLPAGLSVYFRDMWQMGTTGRMQEPLVLHKLVASEQHPDLADHR